MSAFIVSDKHINAMVSFGAIHDVYIYMDVDGEKVPFYIRQNCQKAAEILQAENIRSVDYRYAEKNSIPRIRYVPVNGYTPVQIIKACHCYDYQACETPDYENTTAKKLCEGIESAAIRRLPGYDAAEWSI